MWYCFAPSFVTTVFWIGYLLYQFFAFKSSPLFENAQHGFLYEIISTVLSFFEKHSNLIVPGIIVGIIALAVYFLIPTLFQGGLIQIIARKKKGENIKLIDGFSLGLLVFLPLFEYHLLIKTFGIVSIFTEATFVLRNLGPDALKFLFPVFIIVAVAGFIITLLFTYTDFFIVLSKKGVLRSIGKSCKLMVLNWRYTFLIGILMLIITLRIIFNVIAVLLVPALIIFSAGLIATVTLAKIGIIVGGIIGLIGLFFAVYFNAILEMFANTVWTFTFLELTEQKIAKEML